MSESTYTFYRTHPAIRVRDFAYGPGSKAEIRSFLSLPKEIRDKVYGYYFSEDPNNEFEPETVRRNPGGPDKPWTRASLLLTCKFIAAEGTTTLYRDTHFIFNALEGLTLPPIGIATAGMRWWFRLIGGKNLMQIRSITIGAKANDWGDGHPFRAEGACITIMQILRNFLGSSQIQNININLSLDTFAVIGPKTKNQDIGGMLWYSRVFHTLFDDIGPNNINECLRALPNLTSLQIPYRTFRSGMHCWDIPKHYAIYQEFLVILVFEDRFVEVHSALLKDIEWRRLMLL